MREVETEVLEALRAYVVAYQDSTHDFVRHLGLPVTDGTALGEILYAEQVGAPLSPTALSHRIALTSGATNALLNRLEARGLVIRTREHDDRRVVTLRPTDLARRAGEEFFGGSADDLRASLAAHSDSELGAVRDFLRRHAAILPRAQRRP